MIRRMDSGNKTSALDSGRKRNGRIVDAVISNHFEMLIGDMNDEPLNKLNSGNCFDNEFVVLMSVIMEGNMRAGIRINTGGGNNRPAEIAANVLRNSGRVTVIRLSVDVESVAMITVDSRFNFLEGRTKLVMKTVEQSGTERVA